jgi:DNA-binding winged helix-turn-helix (wHTH) protein
MSEAARKGFRYRFGPFELNAGQETLSRNGVRVKVQGLPYRLLLMLVERPNEIITREKLRQRLWPHDTFVEFDNSLGVAVRKVRDSLNDIAEAPRYVETVPRRGYRFVAPVTVLGSETSIPAEPLTEPMVAAPPVSDGDGSTPQAGKSQSHSRYWLAGVSLVLIIVVAGAIYGFRTFRKRAPKPVAADGEAPPIRTRRSVAVLGFRNLPGRAEDNWLSPAFSEMLATELAANGALRMLPGEDVARAKHDLPLADEDSLAKPTLASAYQLWRRCSRPRFLHHTFRQRR